MTDVTLAELFARRADRACALAKEGGPAASLLLFASSLLSAQGALAGAVEREHADAALTGSPEQDLPRLSQARRAFLETLRSSPAPEVAEEAERRRNEPEDDAIRRLAAAFAQGAPGRDDFVSRATLRPYLEALRAAGVAAPRRGPGCPWCGAAPGVGFLKSPEPSEGARRHLVCAACGNEWPLERIKCPACAEQDPQKLSVFKSEKHPGVRLEACAACRRYVKSLDLTVDARPIPEVDDLLSVAMDLWADAEGWTRLEPGLAGV